MPRGRKTSLTVRLAPADRQTLQAWQQSTTIPAGRARRGRIILLAADGVPISHIADTMGINRRFIYKWVQRFLAEGVGGLVDKHGCGSRRKVPLPAVTTPDEHRAYSAYQTGENGRG